MASIAVTGGAGFIGQHAVKALTAAGHDVHTLGRSNPKDSSANFHAVDLMAPKEVHACLASLQADHLLHLAWYTEPGKFWRSPQNLHWISASLNLLEAFAEGGGKRAVMAGTCAEYDWGSGDGRFDEYSSPIRPSNLYGESKDALRRVAVSYAQTAGLSLAWGRVFFVYGPGEKPGRLVADAIHTLSEGREFPATAGTQRRDFMHAEDVGAAFAALLVSAVQGEVNIASGEAVEVRSLLERIGALTGRSNLLRIGAVQAPRFEPSLIEGIPKRLNEEVGYRPRWTLDDGLQDVLAAYVRRIN
jgi:nucleoside-diphosphate-sugar epimerase